MFGFISCPISPLLDSAVVCVLGENKSKYGRQRVWVRLQLLFEVFHKNDATSKQGTIGCAIGGAISSALLGATNNIIWPFLIRAISFTLLACFIGFASLHWGATSSKQKVQGKSYTAVQKKTIESSETLVQDTEDQLKTSLPKAGPYDWLMDLEVITLFISIFVIGMTMSCTGSCNFPLLRS
jgi:hypothetical protein